MANPPSEVMFCQMRTADFRINQVTLEMRDPFYTSAAVFVLMREDQYRELCEAAGRTPQEWRAVTVEGKGNG